LTQAEAALTALGADPGAPVKLLFVGGVGTGKSAALADARRILRPPGSALFVDDAHELGDTELTEIATSAADPDATVIATAQPCAHHRGLRVLTAAIERHHPAVRLGALTRAEVGRRLGGVEAGSLDAVMTATAGLPLLVDAVTDPRTASQSAYTALVNRLRRWDEPLLSTLLIMSLSPELGPADIAAALSIDDGITWELTDRCYAADLLDPVHGAAFIASVHRAAAQLLGATRHRGVEEALLRTQAANATLSDDLSIALAEHGFRDPRLAAVLQERVAGGVTRPAERIRLLRAAVKALGPEAGPSPLTLPLADASARAGDCATATALTDGVLDGAERAAAVRIAASVATHDGNTAHAAELCEWLGRTPAAEPDTGTDELLRASATIVFIGAGQAETARRWIQQPGGGPPTSSARAARSLAEGLVATLDQPYPVAAARLGQALGSDPDAALPDSAPALLTLAALHNGDAGRARSVIGRAVANRATDEMFVHRHRLLLAWTRMQDGQLQSAAATAGFDTATLHPRDALWAAALHAGIARRGGDTGTLQRYWYLAAEVLAEYAVDLFSLLPLSELWVAAARLQQTDRIAASLDQAFMLLRALDDAPAWSLPLHWAGVHAAILTSSPEAMAPHGRALAAIASGATAGSAGFAGALAAGGRAWLRVLARQVDVDDTAAAARALARFGLTWDATRLAGQAALQTPDPRVSGAMLQLARDLKTAETEEPSARDESVADDPGHPPPRAAQPALSEREREVAELLLLGMPYRDIGAQLFISAKTVEHHVARIRRRLGAGSRSEMLSMLRALLASPV
jgi:DNA-binding CsgD family transcriptional regulator